MFSLDSINCDLMANHFKCLVKLNGNKYSVIVDNDCTRNRSKISFAKVFKKIQQIDEKLDISFDTYLFEVLDKDFDDYVVITDENQLCDNLSRFRVTNKGNKSDKKSNKTNKTTNCDKNSKHKSSPKKTNDNSCRQSTSSPTKSSQSSGAKAHTSSAANSDPKSSFSKTQNTSNGVKDKAIDDLNRNLMNNIDIPVFSKNDIQVFKDMKYFMDINRSSFESNPENNGNWTRISHGVKSKGYCSSKFLPKNLKLLFFKYLGIYEQVLEYASDVRTATEYFPLFQSFQSMNLRSFITEMSFKKLKLLREKFELTQLSSQTKTNCPSDQSASKTTAQSANKTSTQTLSYNPNQFENSSKDLTGTKSKFDPKPMPKPVNQAPDLRTKLYLAPKSNTNTNTNPYLNRNEFSMSHSLPTFIPLKVGPDVSTRGSDNRRPNAITGDDSEHKDKKVKKEEPEVIVLD